MNSGIEFHTITCLNWNHLLRNDSNKKIITDSFKFLVEQERILLFGFVIMSNHIHFIWQVKDNWLAKNIKQQFLKYTAQQIKFNLSEDELALYKSTQSDRQFQFWERRSWVAEMNNRSVIEQKLDYIHQNPVKAGLVRNETDYVYSSSCFYNMAECNWGFITHYMDFI